MEIKLLFRIIADFIGIVMPIYFINKVMPSDKDVRYRLYVIITFIAYLFILIFNNKYNISIYAKYILFAISLLYPMLFRPGNLGNKIFWMSFYVSIMSTVAIFFVSILAILNKIGLIHSIQDISLNNYEVIIIIRIIEAFLVFIVSKNINFVRYIDSQILLLLSFIWISNTVMADTVLEYTFNDKYPSDYFLIIISAGLLFTQIIVFYMLNVASKVMEEKFALEITLKSKQNDEDIMRMHKELRGWRHDMRNHVNIVLGLLERNSPDEAMKYINEIDKRTSEFEEIRYTDNLAVDSIITSKVNLAKERGIEIQLDLNVLSDIKLSNVEICTLLGNLLDNSIEACDKVEEGKFITLKILAQEDKLVIRLKNSTNGNIKKENGVFKTTKIQSGHGIGLTQIDSVVEKYDGYIKRVHENNVFDTSIMINY